jgi:hypothetical protein
MVVTAATKRLVLSLAAKTMGSWCILPLEAFNHTQLTQNNSIGINNQIANG